MYCPVCFNNTLKLASSGVVKATFNKKSRSTTQFFYNISTERPEEIEDKFRNIVKDYFQWYSGFQNKEPITEFELFSSDFICDNGCKIPMTQKINISDVLIQKARVIEIIKEVGDKFQIGVDL
jgi:hypothetical protein